MEFVQWITDVYPIGYISYIDKQIESLLFTKNMNDNREYNRKYWRKSKGRKVK